MARMISVRTRLDSQTEPNGSVRLDGTNSVRSRNSQQSRRCSSTFVQHLADRSRKCIDRAQIVLSSNANGAMSAPKRKRPNRGELGLGCFRGTDSRPREVNLTTRIQCQAADVTNCCAGGFVVARSRLGAQIACLRASMAQSAAFLPYSDKVLSMATLNISIPDSMREWIDAQVAAGGYANASDYIRDLVRYNQRERESILLALIEGERSGVSERSVSDIARQAKRRLQQRG